MIFKKPTQFLQVQNQRENLLFVLSLSVSELFSVE